MNIASPPPYPTLHRAMPVGVFDSGVGGLSVLRALHAELPAERLIYLADSAHAPYGEKGDAFVQQRSLAIARFFLEHHHIKMLVVACNTATAAAVQFLRDQFPRLLIIGVEPAIKPAAAQSRTGRVGVLATRGTLFSTRFTQLLDRYAQGVEVRTQACDGLALAIEQSTLAPADCPESAARIQGLCETYTRQIGCMDGELDTLVLGCTHYVFALPWLQALAGPGVQIIETGAPVARYARSLLMQHKLLNEGQGLGQTRLLTTGQHHALAAAAERWLGLNMGRCTATAVV